MGADSGTIFVAKVLVSIAYIVFGIYMLTNYADTKPMKVFSCITIVGAATVLLIVVLSAMGIEINT